MSGDSKKADENLNTIADENNHIKHEDNTNKHNEDKSDTSKDNNDVSIFIENDVEERGNEKKGLEFGEGVWAGYELLEGDS